MNNFFILLILSVLTSTQAFAFSQFEVFTQVQHTSLTREYQSQFLLNDEKMQSINGLNAKLRVFDIGVTAPIYRNIRVIGALSIGNDKRHNQLWIKQYSLDNNIGTRPNYGGYNDYDDGHLSYKNIKIGLEGKTSDMLTTGVYIAREQVDSYSDTLNSSSIPATSYFEESIKLEGYSDIRSPTALHKISVGIQNIVTLRRSDVSQKFWYRSANNWVSFNAPSIQLLSSPYIVADLSESFSMRMSLTRTVFKSFRQKNVEFESNTLDKVSDVTVETYSGSQTNIALSASYHF